MTQLTRHERDKLLTAIEALKRFVENGPPIDKEAGDHGSDSSEIESAGQDRLLPGQSLQQGEYLVSANGRFRLYVEDNGAVLLYAYAKERRIPSRVGRFNQRVSIWGAGVSPGAGAKITLPTDSSQGFRPWYIANSQGQAVWTADLSHSPAPIYRSLYLVLQDDGNLVQYVSHPTSGQLAEWASDSWHRASQLGVNAVLPNAVTLTILAGQIAINTSQSPGNGDIVNELPVSVGVRDNSNYITLPPGAGVVAIGQAALVEVDAVQNNFTALHGSGADPGSRTDGPGGADAVGHRGRVVKEASPNGRFRVAISEGAGLH